LISNGARLLGECVACSASSNRPWKLPSNASTLVASLRAQLIRHSAIAFSLASAPDATNVTCGNPGTSWRSVDAYSAAAHVSPSEESSFSTSVSPNSPSVYARTTGSSANPPTTVAVWLMPSITASGSASTDTIHGPADRR
jgi:hypothetical protein